MLSLGVLLGWGALRPPLTKERALHAGTPDTEGVRAVTAANVNLSSCVFDAPTPAYDPFMHVSGQPTVLFGVMTGKEMHEERAKSVLLTWCAGLGACIFFSDEHNANKQPATCAQTRMPTPMHARLDERPVRPLCPHCPVQINST